MKTRKIYTVEELREMGTIVDTITTDVLEGQLTIFRPSKQASIDSLFPKNPRKRAHRALTYSYNAKKRNR